MINMFFINIRGIAQLASVSALGAEGPQFESEYPDLIIKWLQILNFVTLFICIQKSSILLMRPSKN